MTRTKPLHTDMELIVQLDYSGRGHHRVVDWITGQDVSDLCYKISLLPGKAQAYLYKPNDEGQFYLEGRGDTVARYHKSFPIVKVYGKSKLYRK